MYTQKHKTIENQKASAATPFIQKQEGFELVDNRPEFIVQRKQQRTINKSPYMKQLQSFKGAPIQRKPDAVFEDDMSRRNKGLHDVKDLDLFKGSKSDTTVTPGGMKVKTKSGGIFSELEEKLNHSQLSRDISKTEVDHDALISQAQQAKDVKGAETKTLLSEHSKKKPGDKKSPEYVKWDSERKGIIDENKLSGKKLTQAQANKRTAIEDKKNEKPNLKNSAALSWIDRHKAVEKAAKAADPLMKSLSSGGDLSSTHERNVNAREQDGSLKGTRSFGDDGATMESGNPLSIVGADEFLNKPDSADRGAPILPELTKSDTGSRKHTDALKSTVGAWGEADVNRLQEKERDATRLLHTKPKSKVKRTDGEKAKKVDSQFYLTVDHYESAMPISPVETDYKRKKKPLYEVKDGGSSSLEQYDKEQKSQENRKKLRDKINAFRAARQGKH